MTIDELVFELKLDPTNFDKGQKQALDNFRKMQEQLEKGGKDIEARNKNVGFSFKDASFAAEGLFTAIAGAGMASFARDTMNSVAATGRMAINIGESTAALSAFGRMIERNGGDAGAAAGSLKGLTDSMTRLNTFGEGSPELFRFLGIIGGKQDDSPIDTFMRFAEWAEKNKNNPQLVNLIGQSGGLDQGTINEALKGRTQVLLDYQAAMKGAVDPAQVAALTEAQAAWVALYQSIEKTGRDVVTLAAPSFVSAAHATSEWIEANQQLADTLASILAGIVAFSALKPALWVLRLLGLGALVDVPAAAVATVTGVVGAPLLGLGAALYPTTLGDNDEIDNTTGLPKRHGAANGGAFKSPAEKEAFIRASAIKAGINPDIAMVVAKSEGFSKFSSEKEASFGAFQLHITPGGKGRAVGDQFKELTGLDPSDPANEHESIMFAMEWAKRHGWHDFHGAAKSNIGDKQGIGEVHIDNVIVQTDSKDPKEHGRIVAREIKDQLANKTATLANKTATQANTGLH